MQDLNDKVTGNSLTAIEFNEPMSELQNVIEDTGQTLSSGDLNQLGKGIAQYASNGMFYTESGAADAYVLTTIDSKQASASYVDGMIVEFIPGNTNTGASTVNVAGLGVKNIIGVSGGEEIVAGAKVTLKYRSGSGDFEVVRFRINGENRIINGAFNINQRAVSGSVVLAAGIYGHDRFKAGAGGCSYTFSTSGGITTLTISAGTLIQVVEGNNLISGDHVLTWEGTAQGQIDGGGFGSNGVAGVATSGTNLSVEFNTGTLTKVQLKEGTSITPFEHRSITEEELLCYRYYYTIIIGDGVGAQVFAGSAVAQSTTVAKGLIVMPATPRVIPSVTQGGMVGRTFHGANGTVTTMAASTTTTGANIVGLAITGTGWIINAAYFLAGNGATSHIDFNMEL